MKYIVYLYYRLANTNLDTALLTPIQVSIISLVCMMTRVSCMAQNGAWSAGYVSQYDGEFMLKNYDEAYLLIYDSLNVATESYLLVQPTGAWTMSLYLGFENHYSAPVQVYPGKVQVLITGHTLRLDTLFMRKHYEDKGRAVPLSKVAQPVTIQAGDSCYFSYRFTGTPALDYEHFEEHRKEEDATMLLNKVMLRGKELPFKPFTLLQMVMLYRN